MLNWSWLLQLKNATPPNVTAFRMYGKATASRQSLQAATYTGQENVSESVEMPWPSYFTVRLLCEQPCLCPAPAPPQRLSSSSSSSSPPCRHTLLLMDELICCKSLSSQTGTLLLPFCYFTGHRIETSAHECSMFTYKTQKIHVPIHLWNGKTVYSTKTQE